ncbi:hypothetical protein CDL15_Pgr005517 [Punica granatum]|uniref:Uncharacterized protein n=1 Tax=Punica granatum TaxID=22663 RepID=A0A218WV59_PUNGR|nr:hypothetical protein CDL15_Pgr005517 [Punica granatum]
MPSHKSLIFSDRTFPARLKIVNPSRAPAVLAIGHFLPAVIHGSAAVASSIDLCTSCTLRFPSQTGTLCISPSSRVIVLPVISFTRFLIPFVRLGGENPAPGALGCESVVGSESVLRVCDIKRIG